MNSSPGSLAGSRYLSGPLFMETIPPFIRFSERICTAWIIVGDSSWQFLMLKEERIQIIIEMCFIKCYQKLKLLNLFSNLNYSHIFLKLYFIFVFSYQILC